MEDPEAVKGYHIYRAYDHPSNWKKINPGTWRGHFWRDQASLKEVTYHIKDVDWVDKGTTGKWGFKLPETPYSDIVASRPRVANSPDDVGVEMTDITGKSFRVRPIAVIGLDDTVWLPADNSLPPGGAVSDEAQVYTDSVNQVNYSGVQQFKVTYKRLENYVDIYTSMARQFYCYSDDTEVLTKKGWRLFQDCVETDEFATRQIQIGKFEWQKATEFCRFRFDGMMVGFTGRSLDMLVTPNHRMLLTSLPDSLVTKDTPSARKYGSGYRSRKRRECVVEALPLAQCKRSQKTGIPNTSVWEGQQIDKFVFKGERRRPYGRMPKEIVMTGDDFCAFMGMYLAEGSVLHDDKGLAITQPEDARGTRRLYVDLLTRLFTTVNPGEKDLIAHSCAVGTYLRQFGHAHEKFIPDLIRGTTPRQLEIFWKYYYAGDGAAAGDNGKSSQVAFTVSKTLADQLTEIIQKMGSSSTTCIRPSGKGKIGNREISTQVGYFVTRHTKTNGFAGEWNAEETEYHGDVFCVAVPNMFLYVRRNGKAAWSGNTVVPVGEAGQELHLPGCPGSRVVNTQEVDEITWEYAEMINRNQWIFEQVGEPAYVLFRRTRGEPCGCVRPESGIGSPRHGCRSCFETGVVGGYYGPYDLLYIPPDTALIRELDEGGGIKATRESRSYLTNTPIVQDGDLIVRRNGERLVLHGVTYKQPRGVLLQQDFGVELLKPGDTRYLIPLNMGLPTLFDPVVRDNPLQGIDPNHLKGDGEPLFDVQDQQNKQPWENKVETPIGRTVTFARILGSQLNINKKTYDGT